MKRVFNSPTLMTWSSLLAKGGNSFFLLPLILTKFDLLEVNFWLVLQVLISLKDLLDFGFVQNISRSYSYALGGAETLENITNKRSEYVNKNLLKQIWKVSVRIYRTVFVVSVLLFLVLGTSFFYKTILSMDDNSYWLVWLSVILGNSFSLYGNIYISALMGINKVGQLRRMETFIAILSFSVNVLILIFSPKILFLVINIQFFVLVSLISYSVLLRKSLKKYGISLLGGEFNVVVWESIKSRSKKSFVAALSGYGAFQIMSLIIANIGSPIQVSSYLLVNRIVEQIKKLSKAPFYSKLPQFSILQAKGERSLLIDKAKFSMGLSYLCLVLPIVGVWMFSDFVLTLLRSEVPFVDNMLWLAIVLAVFTERFAGMHYQLYEVMTNEVIAHRLGLVAAAIMLFSALSLYYVFQLGIASFPFSVAIAYGVYYSYQSSHRVYYLLGTSFLRFEGKVFLPYIIFLGVYGIILSIL